MKSKFAIFGFFIALNVAIATTYGTDSYIPLVGFVALAELVTALSFVK